MNESSSTPTESPMQGTSEPGHGDSRNPTQFDAAGDASLLDLWIILWRRKWWIVGLTSLFIALSIPYAYMQVEWYRANVLLAPSEKKSTSGITGQLGGLAALAGVTVGGDNAESLAILQSREFAAAFIEEQNLLTVLYADKWDPQSRSWITVEPDMRDAVEYFNKNVTSVNKDSTSGLVTLMVQWTDPQLAAAWADLLVRQLNEHLRQRALVEAESNVAYLQSELSKTNVMTLQQSIGRLLEAELQKVMLARGNEEFAFRVIDKAQVPKKRFKPNRTLIVVLAAFLGGMLSVLIVFASHAVRTARDRVTR